MRHILWAKRVDLWSPPNATQGSAWLAQVVRSHSPQAVPAGLSAAATERTRFADRVVQDICLHDLRYRIGAAAEASAGARSGV